MLNRLNLYFEVLPKRLHPWRLWVLLLYIVLISFLAAGIPRFAFTWANDDMFGKEDPVQISLDRIKDLFGGTVSLIMVYRPVDGDLFSNKSLQALRNIHDYFDEESARSEDDLGNPIGLISGVESLLNASYIDVEEDSIHFRDFIDEELPLKSGQNRLLLEQALQEPEYPRVLFSDNTEYGIVMFRTNLDAVPIEHGEQDLLKDGFEEDEAKDPSSDKLQFVEHGLNDYAAFEKAVWEMLQKERFRKDLEFQHPHWGAFYQNDVWNYEFQVALIISLIFSLGLTCLLLGSLRAVIWPTLLILSSMIGVLGLAGWTGWPIDISLYITFGLVGVATVADVVHVLSGYLYFRQLGQSHHQAIRSVFSKTAMACLLTSVTTAIGVFSLYFIQLSVIQTMGLLAGIGVLFAFILTIILLPILMNWFPPRPALKENLITEIKILKITQQIIHTFDKLSTDYTKTVIVLFAIASMILILGM
ncbi:MAG: MMPL family transporter, partial [SAR324 cluster bacterium]|nr:MMPL family transporter [SAR324 cluster bacterium]